MDMSAILGMWPEQFVNILATLSNKSSYEIWAWLA